MKKKFAIELIERIMDGAGLTKEDILQHMPSTKKVEKRVILPSNSNEIIFTTIKEPLLKVFEVDEL